MNIELIAVIVFVLIIAAAIGWLVYRRIPKKLKTDHFNDQWKEVQKYCKNKSEWPNAILEADRLLDGALKRRKFKGKTMGERLVSAQRTFGDNDGVWYAHNLAKKIIAEADIKLKEKEVKEALICFRQALRDIGALEQ